MSLLLMQILSNQQVQIMWEVDHSFSTLGNIYLIEHIKNKSLKGGYVFPDYIQLLLIS